MSNERFSAHFENNLKLVRRYLEAPPPERIEVSEVLQKWELGDRVTLKDLSRLILTGERSGRLAIEGQSVARRRKAHKDRVFVYPPLYVANGSAKSRGCLDTCGFCPWRNGQVPLDKLVNLSPEEIEDEARALVRSGYKGVELVAATTTELRNAENAAATVGAARGGGMKYVGINYFPLEDYIPVAEAGCSNANVWQETYDPDVYKAMIPRGPKSDMMFRLDAQDRALEAGIDTVGVAFLGGLADWRFDALMTMVHAMHLRERGADIVFGLPRMKGVGVTRPANEKKPPPIFTDEDWVLVSHLYTIAVFPSWPWASTRETLELQAEAAEGGGCLFTTEASTAVAGYRRPDGAPQFPINSTPFEEGILWLKDRGFKPVMEMPWEN